MSKSFSADVDAFVLETKKRMTALPKAATQELVDQAQLSDDKGGRMRIDTGFLRASGQMSLSGMPTGPIRGDKGTSYDDGSLGTVTTALSGFELGNTIYFGWTAEYAKYREAYDGFLSAAVQNWQQIVDKVCADIKRRSGS